MPFEDADRLRLAPRFAPLCRAKNGLLFYSEESVLCEEDPLLADILQALFVPRTVSGLEASFDGRRSSAQIRQALDQLSARGLLQIDPEPPSAQSAYWDSVGCHAPSANVDFEALCQTGSDHVKASLKASGISLARGSGFRLVTTDDYLRPELADMGLRQQPWLLAKPVGHTVWIGPLFLPERAPCWSCMALWIRPHRWQQIALYGLAEGALPPQRSFAATESSLGIGANLMTSAVALFLAEGGHPELEGAILSFDTRYLRWHRSIVRPHPECKRCRTLFPREQIAAPLHSFLSPITGILSAVQITDESVCGFFHALGHFPAPLPRPGIGRLLKPQHSVGKGLTSHEAETCCIAEGLERYSVLFRGDEPHVRARADQLNTIPLDQLLLFSDAQYNNRNHWNNTHSEMHWVPEPFDPSSEVDWTEVRSLVTGQAAFVPTAVCFMHYDFRGQLQFCAADSNGCAAGPTFADATLSALLELIERDAVAIWWYNNLNLPKLDLAALGDLSIMKLEAAFAAAGRSLYVLDVTTDLQVPACVAIAPRIDGSEPCFGAAAELTYRRAAFKAISEAAQVCFWSDTGNGSEELLSWVRKTSVHDHPYLCGHGVKMAPFIAAVPPALALQHTVERLGALGLEAFRLDITRPEIGLPVARVFVPRLRHFWARLGPGRLYDVPVWLGLQKSANAEANLNPVACMI